MNSANPTTALLIKGSKNQFWLSLFGCLLFGYAGYNVFSSGFNYYDKMSWAQSILAMFFPLSFLSFLVCLEKLGKPLCEVTTQGINIPLHGFFPWREVWGINMVEISSGFATTRTLCFWIENYKKIVTHPHWSTKLLSLLGAGALKKPVVIFPLMGNEKKAMQMVQNLQNLWTKQTGWNYPFNSQLPMSANHAARRLGLTQYTQARSPEAIVQMSSQISQDAKTLKQANKKHNRQMIWVYGMLIFMFALYQLYKIAVRLQWI